MESSLLVMGRSLIKADVIDAGDILDDIEFTQADRLPGLC